MTHVILDEHTSSLMIGWLLPLGKSVSGKFDHISRQAMSHLRSFLLCLLFFFESFMVQGDHLLRNCSKAPHIEARLIFFGSASNTRGGPTGTSATSNAQELWWSVQLHFPRIKICIFHSSKSPLSTPLTAIFGKGAAQTPLPCRCNKALLFQLSPSSNLNVPTEQSGECTEPWTRARWLQPPTALCFSSPRYRRPLRWKRLFASSLQLFVLLFSQTRNKGLLVRYAWPRDAGNLRFDKRGPTRGGPPVGGGGQWRWENSAQFKKTLMRWDTQHSCGHADCFISLLISPLLSHVQTRFKSVQYLISSHVSNISCGTNRVPLRRWTARSALCLSCQGAWSHTNLH